MKAEPAEETGAKDASAGTSPAASEKPEAQTSKPSRLRQGLRRFAVRPQRGGHAPRSPPSPPRRTPARTSTAARTTPTPTSPPRRTRRRPSEPAPAPDQAPAPRARPAPPATEIPEGGSLFDIEAPAEEPVSRPRPSPDRGRSRRLDHRRRDRPQPGRRRHRRRPRRRTRPGRRVAGHLAARHQGEVLRRPVRAQRRPGRDRGRVRRCCVRAGCVRAGGAASPANPRSEQAEEEKPKAAPSGDSHEPRTDAEIGEGGSLFDL